MAKKDKIPDWGTVFDRPAHDNRRIQIEMPLGTCTMALLMTIRDITASPPDAPELPALFEQMALLVFPVIEHYPETAEIIKKVIFASTGIVVIFKSEPR